MRYFDLDQGHGRPHVREEIPSFEEAKKHLGDVEVFSEEMMRSRPELSDALDRWDRGDRSLYAEDHARFVLSMVAAGDWLELLPHARDMEELFRMYSGSDPVCAMVAELLDYITGVKEKASSLGISTTLRRDWIFLEGDFTETRQEWWDRLAADPYFPTALLGPRPFKVVS